MHVKLDRDDRPSAFALNVPKRILLALVCLLFAAGPVAAATYYVSPAGSGSACSESQPCALSYVNPLVAAGDVVRLAAGTYTGSSIAPASSGVSAGSAGMITYIGSIANPAATIVPSLSLSGSYIRVSGVTITTTGIVAVQGSDNAVEDCIVNASRLSVTGPGAELNPAVKAARNTFHDITFALYRTTDLSSTSVTFRGMENCIFDSCRFTITHPSNVTGGSFLKFFYSQSNRFTDCDWDMLSNVTASCDECNWVVIRDNSAHNAFVRNKFTMQVPPAAARPTVFYAAVAGNAGNAGGVHGLKFADCIWRATNPISSGLVVFQEPMDTDTLSGCVFVAPTVPALTVGEVTGSVIDHCTFVGSSPDGRVFNVSDPGLWTGTSTITNNIFYSLATAATRAPAWQKSASASVSADHNLFYSSAGSANAVDYGWLDFHSTASACSQHSLECASLFGNPQLVGGAGVLTYDAHLTSVSPARGQASDGSDIGALPFAAGGADLIPPAAVTNLAVVQASNDYALLRWTAPGDNGSTGTVAAYELRYSTQPIDAASFNSALLASPAPAILTAGSAQVYAMTGLTASTTYYFVLKARDAAGNWSAISNVLMAGTAATDQVSPATITDIR